MKYRELSIKTIKVFFLALTITGAWANTLDGADARKSLNNFLGLQNDQSLRFASLVQFEDEFKDCEMTLRNEEALTQISIGRVGFYSVNLTIQDFVDYTIKEEGDIFSVSNSKGAIANFLRSSLTTESGSTYAVYQVEVVDASNLETPKSLIKCKVAR